MHWLSTLDQNWFSYLYKLQNYNLKYFLFWLSEADKCFKTSIIGTQHIVEVFLYFLFFWHTQHVLYM